MSRHPQDLDCKVYLGDLSRETNEKDVERACTYYGPLKSVWVARNPAGFSFVEFEDPRDAEDAVNGLDGSTLNGSRIRVEHSTGKIRPKPWLRGGRSGGGGGGGRGGRRPFNPDDKCYQCGDRGHYAYDCQRYSRGGGSRRYSRSRSRSRSRGRRSYSRGRRSYSRSRSRSRDRDRRGSGRDRKRSRDRYSRDKSSRDRYPSRSPPSRSRSRSRSQPRNDD